MIVEEWKGGDDKNELTKIRKIRLMELVQSRNLCQALRVVRPTRVSFVLEESIRWM